MKAYSTPLLTEQEEAMPFKPILLHDGNVSINPHAFTLQDCQSHFETLDRQVSWKQEHIRIYGKSIPLPRLTAWYGDADQCYTYSGISMQPQPWFPELSHIRQQVEALSGSTFNSVLLNFYLDGNSSIAWHSDDEPELGQNPTIASLSFGAARTFHFKHRFSSDRIKLDLTNGSLLLMQGTTQHFWQHAVLKTKKPILPRINLTFRNICDH